jgi:hypothetical protein
VCFITAPKRLPEFPEAKTTFPVEKPGGTLGNKKCLVFDIENGVGGLGGTQ